MKTPASLISIPAYLSFDFMRNGRKLHITFYSGEEGQINISYGDICNTVIKDYCKTAQEFSKMMDTLDDLLSRFPYLYKENK